MINVDIIPAQTPIVDEIGRINDFMRRRWEQVRSLGSQVPSVSDGVSELGLSDALATTAVASALSTGGIYLVSYYIRKTVADGVSSSLTVTISWTEHGQVLTKTFAALTTDTTGANQADLYPIYADANTDISIAIAYASNTPNAMHYNAYARAAFLV